MYFKSTSATHPRRDLCRCSWLAPCIVVGFYVQTLIAAMIYWGGGGRLQLFTAAVICSGLIGLLMGSIVLIRLVRCCHMRKFWESATWCADGKRDLKDPESVGTDSRAATSTESPLKRNFEESPSNKAKPGSTGGKTQSRGGATSNPGKRET